MNSTLQKRLANARRGIHVLIRGGRPRVRMVKKSEYAPPRGQVVEVTVGKKTKLSITEQVMFAKRLSMMLKSGISIIESLTVLSQEFSERERQALFKDIRKRVEQGKTLSQSLSEYPKAFRFFLVNMVRIGEASGRLHETLEQSAEALKRAVSLRKKVRSALTYPAVITSVAISITIILILFVFPKIVPIFSSINTELPIATRIMLSISNFLQYFGPLLLLCLGVCIFFTVYSLRYPSVRLKAQKVLLQLPIVGSLIRNYNIAHFCRTCALLMKSNVSIVESVELCAYSTENLVYRDALLQSRSLLLEGKHFSDYFRTNSGLFPPLMVQMLRVGEVSGNVPHTLVFIAEIYEDEINDLAMSLTTLIEPILMVVLGSLVGFIAIAIISPIYGLTQTLSVH